MKNVEFAKKYGICYDPKDQEIKDIKLFPYQKELLNILDEKNRVAALASRQVGLTQMLAIHAANFLVSNKSDRKVLYIMSHKSHSANEIIERIYAILDKYSKHNKLIYTKNSKFEISIYETGSTVKILSSINSNILTKEVEERLTREAELGRKSSKEILEKNKPYGILIDNAAFIRDFNFVRTFFETYTNVKQIIIFSSFRNVINGFYDEFYIQDSTYTKLKYTWDVRFDKKWYDHMKTLLNGDLHEIDLVRNENEVENTNKSHTLTLRVNNDLYNNICKKLLTKDISLSDYLRDLIEKDTNNNK